MGLNHSHSEYDLLGGTSWDLLWVDHCSSAAKKILERKISPGGMMTEEGVLHLDLVEKEQVAVLLELGGLLGGGVGGRGSWKVPNPQNQSDYLLGVPRRLVWAQGPM